MMILKIRSWGSVRVFSSALMMFVFSAFLCYDERHVSMLRWLCQVSYSRIGDLAEEDLDVVQYPRKNGGRCGGPDEPARRQCPQHALRGPPYRHAARLDRPPFSTRQAATDRGRARLCRPAGQWAA